MNLQQAFKTIENLNLTHEQELALINLVGQFGRDEYTRGFEKAEELTKKYSI